MKFSILDVVTAFERTTDQFFSKDEFKARLRSGRPQRVKYTVDIKTDHLHIGHAVNLWMIRRLQEDGHKAVVVFTDFTSRIGTDDGRLETIASYPEKVIDRKIATLTQQAKMILKDDPKLLEIRRNSEWYGVMGVQDMMNVFSLITHAKLISRDTFQMQMAEGRELYINEMLYPVLQGYDSYKVMSDIAIVGSDQMFNESIGRLIQEKHKKKPQTLITTRMTPGIDGKTKQSQRRDNDVALTCTPRDKFGRVMSIPDELISDYFRMYTDIPQVDLTELDELTAQDPREAKARLATAIVARYHGDDVATKERDWFERTISQGYMPEDIPTLTIACEHMQALDLVVLARPDKSRSDIRRLIQQGGVDLNARKLRQPDQLLTLQTNDILQIGKRQWFRIEIAHIGSFDTERLTLHSCKLQDIEKIISRLPSPDLARYLLHWAPEAKMTKTNLTEGLKKIIFQPEEAETALFSISRKSDPSETIGYAAVQWQGTQRMQHIWMSPAQENDPLRLEALRSLGRHALDELNLEAAAFKNAFAFANVPEVLHEAQRTMDLDILAREDPLGVPGFTPDGWDKLQEWRRTTSPWLLDNESIKSRHQTAPKVRTPRLPAPAPKDDKTTQ